MWYMPIIHASLRRLREEIMGSRPSLAREFKFYTIIQCLKKRVKEKERVIRLLEPERQVSFGAKQVYKPSMAERSMRNEEEKLGLQSLTDWLELHNHGQTAML